MIKVKVELTQHQLFILVNALTLVSDQKTDSLFRHAVQQLRCKLEMLQAGWQPKRGWYDIR